jgi:hypothetical protein
LGFLGLIWMGDWANNIEKMIFLIFRGPKYPQSWV